MNTQEIFDKVALHLLTQGKAAVNAEGMCAYRGENGTSCAVGCLISDDNYHSDLENNNIGVGFVQRAVAKSLGLPELTTYEILLLGKIQCIHDSVSPFYWRNELLRVAVSDCLSTEVIDGFKQQGANNAVTQ